ncbi:MAG: glycosyltransferase [Oscillospiraceae bacterium]|nr:glycosyltransferase [Oscillospiraceae bacterium]
MNQEDREKKLRAVQKAKGSFVVAPAPAGKFKLAKRLGRKLTFWYVQPFGGKQNVYNDAAADMLAALNESIDALEAHFSALTAITEHSLTELRKSQRAVIARNYAEHQEQLKALSDRIDRSLTISAPESRSDAGLEPLTALPVIGTESLFQSFRAVQNAANPDGEEKALEKLGADYRNLLSESVRKLTAPEQCKPIALVCAKFGSAAGMEAIRNEVWDLYRLLQRGSRYLVCIVSIEPNETEAARSGDVHYVPENQLAEWMREHDPALLIFCESTTAIITAGDNCMLLRNAIVRASGQNPARTLGGHAMQEFLHLCDAGVQHYCTASKHAADVLEGHGFRRPTVIYPYINTEKAMFCRKPRPFDPNHMTVGFASSPMLPVQSDPRGIPALCKTVSMNPDVQFIVLWRDDSAVAVPTELKAAPNCEVRTGKCDMSGFYSEIDCLMIPYAEYDHNHACPLSALEAMLMNIPVIATPVSGISELIDACGIGLVAEGTDADALTAALQCIPTLYAAFQEAWRMDKLHEILSGESFIRFAEDCIDEAVPAGVVTLYEWDRQLKLNQTHLVKGHAPLKAYYQRQEVAQNYSEERFSAYPQNCFDLMERQTVSVLLEHFLGSSRHAALLDLASGNGRILQELLPYGKCTAGDASPAMLAALRERFPTDDMTLKELDLLSGDLDGQYDAITIFRFIRHYEYSVRKKLWARLRAALNENGVLLFDVPNVRFEVPHRRKNGWGKYHIYDVFWTRRAIEKELADNGFRLAALVPVGQGLYPMPAEYRAEPMTWTAAAVPAKNE